MNGFRFKSILFLLSLLYPFPGNSQISGSEGDSIPGKGISYKLVPVGKGYASTSVNTAVFRGSSLVTYGDYQYISFYDPEGNVMIGKRKRRNEEWELGNTGYKGKVEDAHNVISLGVDSKGFLHLSFDHHGDPLKYTRSVSPESIEMGELMPMTGERENNVTYPEFYTMPNGDVIFAYRDGESGRGNLILNRYDAINSKWERLQENLLDGEEERNAYWQMFVDGKGTIHLSWVWRETWMVETNHDICYAKSEDGGLTWQKSDGTPYILPITCSTSEIAWSVPQNSELINQTGMTADDAGNPYIATYWRDQKSEIPQYRLVWNDGKEWKMTTVGTRSLPFSLSGGGTKMIPISRPRIASDGKKAFYLFRDRERGSKASLGFAPDLNEGEWKIYDVTDFSVDAWEPTYDINLWNRDRILNIFLQTTHQGDSETLSDSDERESMVYVLEIDPSESNSPCHF